MCRIIALTNFDYKTHSYLIDELLNLARSGKVPPNNTPGHHDGWGIGFYKNNKGFLVKSGKDLIKEENKLRSLIKKINKTNILIMHLRKSSWKKSNSVRNSHPFKIGNFIFCHNGTILDYKKLANDNKKLSKALDSEVYANYVYNNINNNIKKSFTVTVDRIIKNNRFTSLSCVFSQGRKLYAYREYSKLPQYYTLFFSKNGKSHIVSSETFSDLKWKLLPKNKVISF